MPLTHRPAEERDLAFVCGFPQSAEELFFLFPKASYPLSPAQLRAAMALRADSTVVELDGAVAGFANFYRWEKGGVCSLGNIVVAPAARGRGVGRYLVETMVDLAFARHGATAVAVSCFNANTAGLLFYPRLGFEPFAVEERQDKQGRRVALIHMRLARAGHHGRRA